MKLLSNYMKLVENGTGSQEDILQILSLMHHALEAIVAALSSASRS